VTFSHSTSRGHAARESRRSRETFSLGVCNLLLSDISYHCNEPGFNLSVLDVRGASRSRPAYKNSVGCVYAGRLRGGCVYAPSRVCVCSWCMLYPPVRLALIVIHAVTKFDKTLKMSVEPAHLRSNPPASAGPARPLKLARPPSLPGLPLTSLAGPRSILIVALITISAMRARALYLSILLHSASALPEDAAWEPRSFRL